MIITFQILLMLTVGTTLLGILGEKKDRQLRDRLVAIFFASLLAFVATTIL